MIINQVASASAWITGKALLGITVALVALTAVGCENGDPMGPSASMAQPPLQALGAADFTPANGTLTQTEVISEEVRFAGPNTIVELTIAASMSGTLSGTIVDNFTVVIHPNGNHTAQGTTICECTVDGKSGVVELRLTDTGEIVDGAPHFEGRWVIRNATDELSGLRGVLQVDGAVDLATNLSITDYSGWIRFQP